MENKEGLEGLVALCATGNTDVFREIFDELERPLFRYIRIRTKSRDDALDIMQDTFVDLWNSLEKGRFVFTSIEEFYGFVYTIARRKVAKLYRFTRPTVSLEDVSDLLPDEEGSVKEETILLFDSLTKLGDVDREIIRLRYLSGLRFSEIAVLLKKEEITVKVRHHRAIQKLRKILGYEEEK